MFISHLLFVSGVAFAGGGGSELGGDLAVMTEDRFAELSSEILLNPSARIDIVSLAKDVTVEARELISVSDTEIKMKVGNSFDTIDFTINKTVEEDGNSTVFVEDQRVVVELIEEQ